jgi:hypothetical protein
LALSDRIFRQHPRAALGRGRHDAIDGKGHVSSASGSAFVVVWGARDTARALQTRSAGGWSAFPKGW